MAFDINTLNGATFGPYQWGTVSSVPQLNHANGYTDVVTENTDAATGAVTVAYITSAISDVVHVENAVQYDVTDPSHAAHDDVFATFGYIVLDTDGPDGTAAHTKWYIHGFSEHALLLSTSATFTEGDANGTNFGNGYFTVLSTYDLSPGAGATYYTQSNQSFTDSAGFTHYENFNTPNLSSSMIGHFNPSNPNPPNYPLDFSYSNSDIYVAPACFAEGMRIATARGEVAVETLTAGDEVITAAGERRPVTWIGSRRVRPAAWPRPHEVHPVRVRAGAFGEGLPHRDLLLSPGHAVHVDGVLIPIGCLINGASIVQEEVEAIRYFHVELDAHDVLLAEGLPCETYLDDGNRETFANADEHALLHGRLDPVCWDNACAPVVSEGPQLAEVRERLLARAEAQGWRRVEEPDLRLVADGVAVEPLRVQGLRAWFLAPACRSLRLMSNHGVLRQLSPEFSDARRLGVAVSELKLDGVALSLDGPAFGAGFHPLESHEGWSWRWTDGAAELALDLAEGAMIEVSLFMVAPSWRRPAPTLRLVQAG